MPSTYIFTTSPYTKDEVPLGSIVPDILYPNEDAIKPPLIDDDFFPPARDSDLSAHANEDSLSNLQGTITEVWKTICSIFWRVESTHNFEVTAEKGYTYPLKEPKRFFSVLVKQEQGVREFLEKCHKERLRPVLIVGYRTLLNAKLVHADKSSLTMSASGQVTAGGGNVSNDSAGADIQAGRGQKAGEGLALRLDGERIFAIKYRAINIRIVQGDMVTSLERSNLTSWRIFPQTREKLSEKAEVIEALLEESDYTGEGEVVLNGNEETFVKQVQEDALLKDTAESQDFSTSVFFGSQNSGMQIGVSDNSYPHPKLSFMQPEEWQREIVKRRERSEDQIVQASERNRQTTLEELMRYCHNFLSRPLKVETDLRATMGTIPVPTGKCCPTQLRPWADYPARQQEIYQSIYRYLQPAEEDAPRLFVPLTRLEYFGQQLSDRPLNSEELLENYERIAVETHVQDIIAELCKFPGARDQFGLGDGVRFDNDANSPKESEFANTVTKHSSNVHPQPNKFYVHQVDGSSSTLLMKAGYRSPNKLSVESLRVGLRDMAFWEELVNSNKIPPDKEGKLKYNAERLVCSAIAQEYHVMIQQGLAYSYVTNGLARVLLHVPYDDPGTLYYYLCEPNREVNGEDERNFQYSKTSIARVLCLCLMSFSSSPRDQEWRSSALSQLHTWITSFDHTYSQIHEQELEQTCDDSENAEVTEEMVNEAVRSEDRGAALMIALLENRGDEIKITEEVVIAAARNESSGPEVIALLLEKRGDEFKITQEVVKAAARNESSGPEVIALLLEKREDEIKITEEVVKAAAENKACGARFMTSLFKNRGTSKGVRISDEYSWIRSLQAIGYSSQEITDLLLEAHDSPWIFFEPTSFPHVEIQPGRHVLRCCHSYCTSDPSAPSQNLESVSPTEGLAIDDTEDAVETIEELCGLAGISPKTRSKTDWPGSAEFSEDNQTVAISYTLLTDEGQTAHSEIFLSRISHVLEGFCSAAGLTQARGLCCDSFTVLKLSGQGQETQSTFCGELVPVKFQLAADLAKAVKLAQAPVPEKPAFQMLLAKSKTILEHVLPDLTQIQGFNGIQWCFQLCALAVQFLCLGFVSYTRAHIGPLQPFFLDTPLRQVVLLGLKREKKFPSLVLELFDLNCFGYMTRGPALMFRSSQETAQFQTSHGPHDQQLIKRYDICGQAEYILDTWGPGYLIYPENSTGPPAAIKIGDGFVYSRRDGKHHWTQTINEGWNTSVIDLERPLTIGSSITSNLSCKPVESDRRLASANALEYLGTSLSSWQTSQRQVGLQGGQYIMGQLTTTWSKQRGISLKDVTLTDPAEELIRYMDEYWGVKVSYCTGVARRVLLRTLVADLLRHFSNDFDSETRAFESNLRDQSWSLRDIQNWLGNQKDKSREKILKMIRKILNTLRPTGLDPTEKYLSIAWPFEGDTFRCFRVPLEQQSSWAKILADSHDCATFAYITMDCLETDEIKCSKTSDTFPGIQLLETTVVHALKEKLSYRRNLQHEEIYFFSKLDSLLWVKVQRERTDQPASLVQLMSIPWEYYDPSRVELGVLS